jgi:uncharacterized protein YjbJ (UPF0337 family)
MAHCCCLTEFANSNARTRPEGINRRRDSEMDKDRIAGAAKQVKGAVKEATGKAFGDSKLAANGKSDKAEGKIQNAVGGVKDAVKDAWK